MTKTRRVVFFLALASAFAAPAHAQQFDGVWSGTLQRGQGTAPECDSAPVVALITGATIFGSILAPDGVPGEFDELLLTGTVDGAGNISNGEIAVYGEAPVGTFAGSVSGTTATGTWDETGNPNCFGTFTLVQDASFSGGFDELWTGTATQIFEPNVCDANSELADVFLTITNDAVRGAVVLLLSNENDPAVLLLTGTLDGGRNLTGGVIVIGGQTLAAVTGSFGADSTNLQWTDGECSGAVNLTRVEQNTAPTANDQAFSLAAGASYQGTLTASDPDVGDVLSYVIVANATQGIATITDAATGAFTYTANAGASGQDQFTFSANDGTDDSNVATVTVTITQRPANGGFISTILSLLLGEEPSQP